MFQSGRALSADGSNEGQHSHVVRIDLIIKCVSEFLSALVITVSSPVGVIHHFHQKYTYFFSSHSVSVTLVFFLF